MGGGGADRNWNKSADSRVASANYPQLIDSETLLFIRTSGDRLIIVRCGVYCGVCGGGFGKNRCRCHIMIIKVIC